MRVPSQLWKNGDPKRSQELRDWLNSPSRMLRLISRQVVLRIICRPPAERRNERQKRVLGEAALVDSLRVLRCWHRDTLDAPFKKPPVSSKRTTALWLKSWFWPAQRCASRRTANDLSLQPPIGMRCLASSAARNLSLTPEISMRKTLFEKLGRTPKLARRLNARP